VAAFGRDVESSKQVWSADEGYPGDEPPPPRGGGFATAPHPFSFVFVSSGLKPVATVYQNPRRWQAPRPPRPRRILLPSQRRALDELISLGAKLEPDFTTTELRTAFRTLALEYHPDRHAGSSDLEKQRLSALFTRLRHAYDLLQQPAQAAA
jgi:hypothetical protein